MVTQKNRLGEVNAVPDALPPKTSMSVEKRLRTIVQRCLGGPGGDPDRHHMIAAAHAFLALRQLGLSTSKDDEGFLRNNNWEMDFIDLAERDVVI